MGAASNLDCEDVGRSLVESDSGLGDNASGWRKVQD
jgi:hypothetical protein